MGVGGSVGYADAATGFALALTKNRLSFDFGTVMKICQIVTEFGSAAS